jgi:protoporphyrinogen IX oxidase
LSAWLLAAYPWLKSLHIIAMVSWMAGLLYLPRLFVYHAMAPIGSGRSETFKVMERRLERAIMRPALALTLFSGAFLAATPGIVDWRQGWIWAKLACVAGLLAFHALCISWQRAFAGDRNRHSSGFFRVANELPTAALIAIVLLVVAKPF